MSITNPNQANSLVSSQASLYPSISPPSSLSRRTLSNSKLSQISFVPLENMYASRNVSYFSEYGVSFTTEQLQPSNRVSVVSEDMTEVNCHHFKFEKKVQKNLKLLHSQQRYCNTCNTNTYFAERYELQKLGILQFLTYWIQSIRCCSEPKALGKYHVKRLYCIFCGGCI